MRVLFIVHGHPSYSIGGAENAAFALYKELDSQFPANVFILSAYPVDKKLLGPGEIMSIDGSENEYLIGTDCGWLPFFNLHPKDFSQGLTRFINYINPDIIHIHHYLKFGIDLIPLLASIAPNAQLITTLHEYLPLCLNNGQMLTTQTNKLCEAPSILKCSRCFPDVEPNLLFQRDYTFRTILQKCQALVSPSKFLVDRFVSAGYDSKLFSVIENGLPRNFESYDREEFKSLKSSLLNRFAFFGQLNPYKGVTLLLQAAQELIELGVDQFSIEIYGANLEHMALEFQDLIKTLHANVKNCVFLRGSYSQENLPELMPSVDWVLVPSIWWENSPVVIQEAHFFYRPVIASNIGGMKEKVHGLGGLLFGHASHLSLATTMASCIGNHDLHGSLQEKIPTPFYANKCAKEHTDLYTKLLAHPNSSGLSQG